MTSEGQFGPPQDDPGGAEELRLRALAAGHVDAHVVICTHEDPCPEAVHLVDTKSALIGHRGPWEPTAMLLMKAGAHGPEQLPEILERKRMEQGAAGATYWGYGGTVCNPTTQVQPFFAACLARGIAPRVVMPITTSDFRGSESVAGELSEDGQTWRPTPPGVRITSARYALVLRDLTRTRVMLDYAAYEVAVGQSQGTPLNEYIRNRVDKACAFRTPGKVARGGSVQPALTARLVSPGAVFVR